MQAQGADIQTKIAEELALARERWPGRRLYLVLGTSQMRELEEAFNALIAGLPSHLIACAPPEAVVSFKGIPIRETQWWEGIRALPEPEPILPFLGMPRLYVPQERERLAERWRYWPFYPLRRQD